MKTTRILTLTGASLSLVLVPSLASAMMPTAEINPWPSLESGPSVLQVRDVLSNGSDRLSQLNQVYTDCLIEAGAPTIDPNSDSRPVPAANLSTAHKVALAWPPPAGVRQACADLEPVNPPILGAATNSNFSAQARSYVTCLQSHGAWVRLLNEEILDWTYRADHKVPDDIGEIDDACLVTTFGTD